MTAAASAPASSANLGPGYDVVALALDLRCRVEVEASPGWEIRSGGTPAGQDAAELVHRMAAVARVGGTWSVDIESEIPRASGLGSSAAVITAGIAALRAAAGLDHGREIVFRDAVEVEGHPDNVAAAVWGGAVAVGPRGRVHQLALDPGLKVIVAVPEVQLRTSDARRATVSPVPTEVAVRTASRLVFLIEGLRTADRHLLAEAGGDELHEHRRAHLSQRTVRLVRTAMSAGALHAAWSGAGPSAVALVDDDGADAVRSVWREIIDLEGGMLLEPHIAATGLIVEELLGG